MGLNAPEVGDQLGFDMTPMIDITFQLIIFFMLTMDMSQQEVEAVIMPTASEAKEDKEPDPDRVMVNICHADKGCPEYEGGRVCRTDGHWVIKMRGEVINFKQLNQKLAAAALTKLNVENPNISDRPLMVRADERAPFGQVQKVMREAALNKMWKIEIGAKQALPD